MIKKNDEQTRRVLVVATHPDDEVLGCGGTLALHAARGDRIWVVIACEGESARDEARNHTEQTERARLVLGIERVINFNFPDQKLDTLSLLSVIGPLEEVVNQLQPQVVYCHHGGDINRDHQLLFQALMVATRPTVACIEAIYAFDTASSTEWGYPRTFVPDTWVDISASLPQKLEAMACYPMIGSNTLILLTCIFKLF